MLMPADIKALAGRVRDAGKVLPKEGDVALLEWPTLNDKREFRLTFLDRNSALFSQAYGLFQQAQNSDATVGDGACWLPDTFSPPWA
jgi:hypothetical protein